MQDICTDSVTTHKKTLDLMILKIEDLMLLRAEGVTLLAEYLSSIQEILTMI